MNLAATVTLVAVAVNPFGVLYDLGRPPSGAENRRLAAAAVVAVVVAVGVAAAVDPVLRGLDVAPETFRIGAGLALAALGAVSLSTRHGTPWSPLDSGSAVAIAAPLAYPVMIGPAAVVAAAVAGADHGILAAGVPVAGAVGAVLVAGRAAGPGPAVRALTHLTAACLVVLGVAAVIAGIRDV